MYFARVEERSVGIVQLGRARVKAPVMVVPKAWVFSSGKKKDLFGRRYVSVRH
jgi:hypothetical protein